MANLTPDMQDKTSNTAQGLRGSAQMVAQHVQKMSHDAGESLGSMASDFANSTGEFVRSGRTYVRENPAKGVAMAAAAGVVAGSLLTLALQRRH